LSDDKGNFARQLIPILKEANQKIPEELYELSRRGGSGKGGRKGGKGFGKGKGRGGFPGSGMNSMPLGGGMMGAGGYGGGMGSQGAMQSMNMGMGMRRF
jgi:ATP-dependent RNA helicase DDX5/DBP2